MRSIHSYVLQILEAVGQCRIWHGFTANYLDGIQPTWVSIPYQAIGAYKGIRAADVDRILPEIDTTICLEVLQTMAPHYKLAGMYYCCAHTVDIFNQLYRKVSSPS